MNSLNLYLMLRSLTPVQNAGRIVRSPQQEVGGARGEELTRLASQARIKYVCVWKGGSKHKANWVGWKPRPLKRTILTQTGCTFIFMKDIQLTINFI